MVDKMTSSDVKEALLKRWPPDQYLTIQEAPQNSDRSGRKLDLVVVSLWRSRGLSLDGVEIKVSMSDWKRELEDPDKADWWHEHVHRFWIAAPTDVAKKIKPQLPIGWGLLSCSEVSTTVLVHPEPNPNPTPFTWPETVGLMRATAGLSVNMLLREFQKGRKDGYEAGLADSSRKGNFINPDEGRRLKEIEQKYNNLKQTVQVFEEASGIEMAADKWGAGRIGEAAKILLAGYVQGPGIIDDRLVREADQLRLAADSIDRIRKSFGTAFDTPGG